jgi:hypothetical protein
MKKALFIVLLIACCDVPLEALITTAERQSIDRKLGTSGKYISSESTYKLTFPREDVTVDVQGHRLTWRHCLLCDPVGREHCVHVDVAHFENFFA